ncbi:MAG: DoxX family protein [Chthoniobacterales bacterium]
MILTALTKYRDFGLLFLRIGIGAMFVFVHGWPKIAGGIETWKKLGGAMGNLGITFAPEFWGFMAAITEFGGGILFAVGFLFRPATAALAFTMIVAAIMKYLPEQSFFDAAHPTEMAIVFLAMLLIGPGRFSFDRS